MNFDKDVNNKIEKNIETKTNLLSIQNEYFFQIMFDMVNKRRTLESVRYNKKLQNILNLSAKDYKDFLKIIIEINIAPRHGELFMNSVQQLRNYYHIYFDDNEEEYKECNFRVRGDVKKIKIIIDKEIISLENLFVNRKNY